MNKLHELDYGFQPNCYVIFTTVVLGLLLCHITTFTTRILYNYSKRLSVFETWERRKVREDLSFSVDEGGGGG